MKEKIEVAPSSTGEIFSPHGFVKWAGGKRQLAGEIRKLIPAAWDPRRDLYCEPFVGSGALFWELRPSRAWLNDLNADLANAWHVVAEKVSELVSYLSDMTAQYKRSPEATYYAVRGWESKELGEVARAARFIFLNKAGFNGLHRVNGAGKFNVPWGHNGKVCILDAENLKACSSFLSQIALKLSSLDFAELCPIPRGSLTIPQGSLVYVDPPYSPVSRTSNFTRFTKEGFGQKEHVRLAEWCSHLVKRGVHVLVSQSTDETVVDLYRKEGFAAHLVSAVRKVNSAGHRRGTVGEYVLVGSGGGS